VRISHVFTALSLMLVSRPLAAQQLCSDPANGGLNLPPGFCATLFADVPGARHLVVSSTGDVFVATNPDPAALAGGVRALRDTNADGVADTAVSFGPAGGSGIALSKDALYFAPNDRIIRYAWTPGLLKPTDNGTPVVTGLPVGGHSAKTMVVGPDGMLYVDHGSATNSCQEVDRIRGSMGKIPCPELQFRAGIWRYDPAKTGQSPAHGTRWATGLRNAMAIGFEPTTGVLWTAVHGRDQLGGEPMGWGMSPEKNSRTPSEEFGPVPRDSDWGWPYCYHDPESNTKVVAPEYAGDGRNQGDCAEKAQPVVAFPAHWAPMQLAFYNHDAFGQSYRGGVFIAFHGSWNRFPVQEGFRVVFQPFRNGRPSGDWTTFAIDASSPTKLRASGVAVGPDGALYIASDGLGKVWRITRGRG
jgi:glucose/arabinose dehydrogenase